MSVTIIVVMESNNNEHCLSPSPDHDSLLWSDNKQRQNIDANPT